MRSRRVLFHFFITIVFIIFLFYSVNQKKVEMTIYNIIVCAIISLGSYIRYKKIGLICVNPIDSMTGMPSVCGESPRRA